MEAPKISDEKLEYLPETVDATERSYETQKKSAIEDDEDRTGAAILSLIASFGLPIVVILLLLATQTPAEPDTASFAGSAIESLWLFLILIFIVPISTIFSIIAGILAYKKSPKKGRLIALASGLVTLIGVVLLFVFINALANASTI